MAGRLKFAFDTLILSYARIFFSESRLLGACIFASSMVIPSHGVYGLLGGVFANMTAYIMGVERKSIVKGLYGFNGVLTGLALGFFYDITVRMVLLLFIVSLLLTFMTIILNAVFRTYLGLPAMSMPFNIATWLVTFANLGFGFLHLSGGRPALINMPVSFLPGWANLFFTSLGATLFQVNTLSGIIIAAGVLLYSRIALIVMAAGFFFARWMHGLLGVSRSIIETKYLGFNYMLTALAIGAVFAVPGPGSFVLALISVALSVIILTGTCTLFPAYLSPLALPFNAAVLLVLYGLKSRIHPSMGINLAPEYIGRPEANLGWFRESVRWWKRWGVSISVPFHGRWMVSQGIGGAYTHRDDWRFAYDFQAVGSEGKTFKNSGSVLEDFYSYGLPVIAPAAGKVVSARDGVRDNPVGKVNLVENWGNYVIIEHAPNFYSCIAHLKEGSAKVAPGQYVRKADIIGHCGNSGRSPYPHVHLQFQFAPNIGTATERFEFSNIFIQENKDSGRTFLPRGTLPEKAIVQNMTAQNMSCPVDYDRYFPYAVNGEWAYKFKRAGGREETETWRLGRDPFGNTFLISSPKETRLFFQCLEGLLSIRKIEGRRDSGLFFLGSALSDTPFLQDEKAAWTASEDVDYAVSPFYIKILDVFSLLGVGLKQRVECTVRSAGDRITLYRKPRLYLKTPLFEIPLGKMAESKVVFRKEVGVETAGAGKKQLIQARA